MYFLFGVKNMEHILTTDKPWVLVIFALVCINIIGGVAALAGVANPLAIVETSDSIFMPALPAATPSATGATVIDMAVVLSLALWVVIAYGVAKAMTWTWWLLTFQTIVTLITGVLGFLTAQPVAIISFVVYILLFAALFKKEVVAIFNPNLKILPKAGLW